MLDSKFLKKQLLQSLLITLALSSSACEFIKENRPALKIKARLEAFEQNERANEALKFNNNTNINEFKSDLSDFFESNTDDNLDWSKGCDCL